MKHLGLWILAIACLAGSAPGILAGAVILWASLPPISPYERVWIGRRSKDGRQP